ncbi:hypothetical protein HQQ94_21780 [Shewanella sp. VB17]|uniref:hypothetical protein n=1 Tax=Shewanella sp. VB17 TaxID=2739432 RepID=UPI001565A3FE|nr:hypothetical protein [Shewanella sp. VB17]NRD75797.1 hypothetical protein [Shewanella sp. VB17]
MCSIILATISITAHTADKQHIKLAFIADPSTNLYMKFSELVYIDAFNRLNIDVSFIVLPPLRASNMADLGKIDGEIARHKKYSDAHPNLIRINEPLFNSALSAFTINPAIKIKSWGDIKNSQYKVEYYRGVEVAQQRLSQLVPASDLTDSSYPINSLRRLLRGRIDIYIDAPTIVNALLVTPEFTDKNIQLIATLEEGEVYSYLHKQHAEVAIKLAQTFKVMKSEGVFAAYLEQAKQFMLAKNDIK